MQQSSQSNTNEVTPPLESQFQQLGLGLSLVGTNRRNNKNDNKKDVDEKTQVSRWNTADTQKKTETTTTTKTSTTVLYISGIPSPWSLPGVPSYLPPPPPARTYSSSTPNMSSTTAAAAAAGGSTAAAATNTSNAASHVPPPPPPTNGNENRSTCVCFHEKDRTKLQSVEKCIESFQNYASSVLFSEEMGNYGFVNPSFSRNKYLQNETCLALNKFQKGFEFDRHHSASGPVQQTKKTKTEATIGLVFHGTRSENIENILQNGLDVKLRKGQAYGAGEYFSKEPGVSISYCHGGLKMLVFAVVLPGKISNQNCPHNYAVVENNNHQLPIGTVSFSSVSHTVISRSQHARNRLKALEKQLEIQQRMTKDNEIKLKILKFIFKGQEGFEQASALYTKHCDFEMVSQLTGQVQLSMPYEEKEKDEEPNLIDSTKFASFVSCIDQGKMGKGALSYLSCREISHYYWKCPNTERADRKCVAEFFFPSLPPPLTIKERDSIGTGSALCFEAAQSDMRRTKDDVEKARKNLKSSFPNQQP